MNGRLLFRLVLVTAISSSLLRGVRAEKHEGFEGVVTARLARAGMPASHFRFTRKGSQLRIETTDNKLEAINIVDLGANTLTIIYPHNTTYLRLALSKKNDAGETTPAARQSLGFPPPQGFPAPASMPQLAKTSGMAPNTSMPAIPIPPMSALEEKAELHKTDQTKKLQGFACTLYTAGLGGQQLEIWATDDAALFPFRLIAHDPLGRSFGPRMLEETWPELLPSLFPMEVYLKGEPGDQERLSFKVDTIEQKKIEDSSLFQPPDNYIEMQSPR